MDALADKCNGQVSYGFMNYRRCRKPAKFFEQELGRAGGSLFGDMVPQGPVKGFCGTHAPSKKAARREKRTTVREADDRARRNRHAVRLEGFVHDILECGDSEKARKLALDIKAWGLYSSR